jgi:hemoglobin-like flavoprotein
VDFFLRVFDERPDFLELFRFGGATFPRNEHGQRDIPAPLKKHALTVMKTIGECVSGLSRFEDLVPKLRSMGQVHATVGVQSHHYDVVLRHLIDAIAAELGPDEWDGETRDAWELAFRSIIGVIKHPNELLQLEPLEGWGMANALACLYITLYTPFRMAGFTARHDVVEDTFNVFTSLATACLALDMATGWIVEQLPNTRSFSNQSKHPPWRQTVDRWLFPIKFRTKRFFRSLKMERWSSWPLMDFVALSSFPLQYAGSLFLGYNASRSAAGVHWTYMFGLLRLACGARVLHFLHCAENNLMLRRRTNESERSALRIAKLLMTMLTFVHFSACLWVLVARLELGPLTTEPKPSAFFPNEKILLGGTGIINSYLHAVHWAWVNLAGIGASDSSPETSVECLATLLVHFCGATLYTITTGNVVAILETMAQKQGELGDDLAELGDFMHRCKVPSEDQKRIMEGFMMHTLVRDVGGQEKNDDEPDLPVVPHVVDKLPLYIRQDLSIFARAEAIKCRDPAFRHCSNEFLFALVGPMQGMKLLLPGDYFFREKELVPQHIILVEKGTLEVIANGKCVRTLQRGDVIGKRWLLQAGHDTMAGERNDLTFKAQTSLRAHTACNLITGYENPEAILNLRLRYPKDFILLKGDRERINTRRQTAVRRSERTSQGSHHSTG